MRGPRSLVIAAGWCASVAGGALVAQTPTFRSGVDVVQLDVSVIDKNRMPVRGLSAGDFHVSENGDTEPIVDVAEVNLLGPESASAAWLHLVQPDVETNALTDRLGGGQIVVVAFDGPHLPGTALELVGRARDIAYKVVDRLSGVDLAAVFSTEGGLAAPFTNDPMRLKAAIAQYRPSLPRRSAPGLAQPALLPPPSDSAASGPAIGRSSCEKEDPTIPSLLALSRSLAQIPRRRKTIILISTGDAMPFVRPASGCSSMLSQMATDLFWQAQRANINIHTFDPTGERSPAATISGSRRPPAPPPSATGASGGDAGTSTSSSGGAGGDTGRLIVAGSGVPSAAPPSGTGGGARGRGPAAGGATGITSLEVIAESTGGDVVTRSSAFDAPLDRVFEGNRAYYLVSYRTTHPAADGKYRRIGVTVRQSGATVLTRRGYFGASTMASSDSGNAIIATEASLLGVPTTRDLDVRVAAAPFVTPGPVTDLTSLVISLGVRTFVPRARTTDTISIVSTVEDAHGTISAPSAHSLRLALDPDPAVDGRFEISWRLDVPPGRQTVRLNVHSALADRSGTVFATVDVPNLRNSALAMSGLLFAERQGGRPVVDWTLTDWLSVAPTTTRQFARGERVSLFCRLYEFDGAVRPVAMRTQVLGVNDEVEFDGTDTIAEDRFTATHAADFRIELQTGKLKPGMHLLDLHAQAAAGASARRTVPFLIR